MQQEISFSTINAVHVKERDKLKVYVLRCCLHHRVVVVVSRQVLDIFIDILCFIIHNIEANSHGNISTIASVVDINIYMRT